MAVVDISSAGKGEDKTGALYHHISWAARKSCLLSIIASTLNCATIQL
jgi:hypothetical protein